MFEKVCEDGSKRLRMDAHSAPPKCGKPPADRLVALQPSLACLVFWSPLVEKEISRVDHATIHSREEKQYVK